MGSLDVFQRCWLDTAIERITHGVDVGLLRRKGDTLFPSIKGYARPGLATLAGIAWK